MVDDAIKWDYVCPIERKLPMMLGIQRMKNEAQDRRAFLREFER